MGYQNLVLNLGVWPPVVTSSSLSPSRRLRKQYTHSTPTANPPSVRPRTPPFRAGRPIEAPGRAAAVVLLCCALQHTTHALHHTLEHNRASRAGAPTENAL